MSSGGVMNTATRHMRKGRCLRGLLMEIAVQEDRGVAADPTTLPLTQLQGNLLPSIGCGRFVGGRHIHRRQRAVAGARNTSEGGVSHRASV